MLAGKERAQGNHIVIKTHQWSSAWDCQQADHIFLTHRNLQEVVASYRRVGWAFNIPDSYVDEHQLWRVSRLASCACEVPSSFECAMFLGKHCQSR